MFKRMMGLEPTTFCMARGSWVRPVVSANPHGYRLSRAELSGSVTIEYWQIRLDSGELGHWKHASAQTIPCDEKAPTPSLGERHDRSDAWCTGSPACATLRAGGAPDLSYTVKNATAGSAEVSPAKFVASTLTV